MEFVADKRAARQIVPVNLTTETSRLEQRYHDVFVTASIKAKSAPPHLRSRVLEERRALKMASSAHAYVRGSTVQFYKGLEERGDRAVPKGPPVWICGDCHAGNLGPLAATDGSIHVQIRDVDQTVIGNPNHDLIRLALSLASAARGSDLPGVTTAHMLEQMMIGYQRALKGARAAKKIESDRPESIKVVMRKALSRTWKHLARGRLEDLKPNIPRGERFWPLTKEEKKAIAALFDQEDVRRLVTSLKSRPNDARRSATLDAPSWLWASVVELASTHEAAYLEHCRRYALA